MKMRIWCMILSAWCLILGADAQEVMTRVDIESQPVGATIVVDGKDRGVTPISLFDLKPGRHHLKCRCSGYVTRDRFITVEAGRPLQRSMVLEPEKGLFLIKSEPAGCKIEVDGVSIGETPRLITTLDAKDPHRVTLRKTGYRPSVFEVRFSGRTPIVRNEQLVLDSGVINVVTDPAGAEVMVNGIVRGKSPIKVDGIPKGRATVRLRLDGFAEEIRELSMNAGDSQTLSLVMNGLPGTLRLSSVPAGARFYLDGSFVGEGRTIVPKLSPGDYRVRAELAGYSTSERVVTIKNGEGADEEFRLSNNMGRIEIRTSPAGAHVFLDGKSVGNTSTTDRDAEFSDVLSIENVMEGDHVLTIRADGCRETTRHPKIVRQKTSHWNVRLNRVLVPDVEIVTDSGAYTGRLMNNAPDYVTIEVKLGVQRSFPRSEIRAMNFLNGGAQSEK